MSRVATPKAADLATPKGTTRELIILLLAPFPIGYFIRNQTAAYLAYIALHSFVFTFQSTTLLKEWAGGDYSAYVKNRPRWTGPAAWPTCSSSPSAPGWSPSVPG
jgi:hypothetical protein